MRVESYKVQSFRQRRTSLWLDKVTTMYSLARIKTVHTQLQTIFKNGLVLLGGSYVYNEADEQSDLDFYYIGSIWDCLFYRRYKKAIVELRKDFSHFSLMFLPNWAVKRGYFYFYARNLEGKIFSPPINKRLAIGNALKFSHFNYLRYLIDKSANRERFLRKAMTQLLATRCLASGVHDVDPVFSEKYLRAQGYWSEIDFMLLSDQVLAELKSYLNFSPINYLIYNAKFVIKGEFKFVFKNPDKYIISELRRGLKKNENLGILLERIKKIIFPTIIL